MNKAALLVVILSGFMLSSFHRPYASSSSTMASSSMPMRSISSASDFNEGAALRAHYDAKREAVKPAPAQVEY